MSYINPIYITEKLLLDAYNKDGLVGQLALTDRAVNRMVQTKGVSPDLIPVDVDGYATTSDVIEYALAHLGTQVYRDLWGAGHGEEDIYYDKYQDSIYQERKFKGRATYDTITSNVNETRSSYYKQVPVM